ncbi:hypothetical protein BJ508DRAFT_316029 [Ascobolus immersus RN42]|uniref:Uncharacterized protein n=1 Tax=Ascobolus immersus RN42 TaxID=1160509 RepID=A0A3N4HD27_ASCIM|nr:hypothetical protein BJ508DRAFT_316029 [Ascobolus immersus RN42]
MAAPGPTPPPAGKKVSWADLASRPAQPEPEKEKPTKAVTKREETRVVSVFSINRLHPFYKDGTPKGRKFGVQPWSLVQVPTDGLAIFSEQDISFIDGVPTNFHNAIVIRDEWVKKAKKDYYVVHVFLARSYKPKKAGDPATTAEKVEAFKKAGVMHHRLPLPSLEPLPECPAYQPPIQTTYVGREQSWVDVSKEIVIHLSKNGYIREWQPHVALEDDECRRLWSYYMVNSALVLPVPPVIPAFPSSYLTE